jgi:hypothetical protein
MDLLEREMSILIHKQYKNQNIFYSYKIYLLMSKFRPS